MFIHLKSEKKKFISVLQNFSLQVQKDFLILDHLFFSAYTHLYRGSSDTFLSDPFIFTYFSLFLSVSGPSPMAERYTHPRR